MMRKIIMSFFGLGLILLFKIGFSAYLSSFMINIYLNIGLIIMCFVPILGRSVISNYRKVEAELGSKERHSHLMVYSPSTPSNNLYYGTNTRFKIYKSAFTGIAFKLITCSALYVAAYGSAALLHELSDNNTQYETFNVFLSDVECDEVTALRRLCSVAVQSEEWSVTEVHIPESIGQRLTDGNYQLKIKINFAGSSIVDYLKR